MSHETLKCYKCGNSLNNFDRHYNKHICIDGELHKMDRDKFRAWKDDYAKSYIKNIELEKDDTIDDLSTNISSFLRDMFNHTIMTQLEREHAGELEHKRQRHQLSATATSEQDRKEKLQAFDQQKSEFVYFKYISANLISSLNISGDVNEVLQSEEFNEMIDNVSEKLLYEKTIGEPLLKYIKAVTGMNYSENREELRGIMREAFDNHVRTVIEEAEDTLRSEFFMSLSRMERILREDIIHIIIDQSIDGARKRHFDNKLREYVNNQTQGYQTFVNIIKYFSGVLLMKTYEADSYIDPEITEPTFIEASRKVPNHFDEYIDETLKFHLPHNLTYDFSLPVIIFRYQYSIRTDLHEGTQYVKRRGKITEIYDFMQLYKNIEPEESIKWIVHKKEIVRVRSNIDINQVIIDEHPEHFSVYFDGTKLDPNFIHFGDCSASFDLSNSKCYLNGTLEQIKWMVTFFAKYKYVLSKPVFNTFKGSISVISKAIYSKRIFQSILKYSTFADYWHTRNNTSTNNNFLFIFHDYKTITSTTINTNEYVQLNIQQTNKINIMDNKWEFEFEGNRHDYLIPFISMLLSMIHFTSNLVYNKKFESYVTAERNVLQFYTNKTGRNSTRKSTDTSLMSVAQRIITKKDVYNNSIADIVNTPEEKAVYSGRTKPFLIHYFPSSDAITVRKWSNFFVSAAMKANKLLLRTESPQYKVPNCSVHFIDDKIYMRVVRHNGTVAKHLIGVKYLPTNENSMHTYYITYYPEKSNVYSIDKHNDVWIKLATVSEKPQQTLRISQNIRLRDRIPAVTENAVTNFTNEPIRKISFFEPYNLESDQTIYEHLHSYYKSDRAIIALCKQHLWDHSDEEILDSLKVFDMKKHHELIQNYLQSTVLYFEFNEKERNFKLAFPRHKYWYAYNYHYSTVTFVFRGSNDMYEVVYFTNPNGGNKKSFMRSLPIESLIAPNQIAKFIRSFDITSSTGYIKRQTDLAELTGGEDEVQNQKVIDKPDITYERLDNDFIKRGLKIRGQLFDGNGKSIGVRLRKGEGQYMDVQFAPQFVIMPSDRDRAFSLHAVTESLTNIDPQQFKIPSYYTVVEQRTSEVRYNIAKLNDEYETRRKMLYYISRMIITHWLLYRSVFQSSDDDSDDDSNNNSNDNSDNDSDDNSNESIDVDPEEYLEEYIGPISQELVSEQRIDKIVVPMYFDTDIDGLEEYLSEIMPNHFHDGKFRVREEDVEPLKVYMRRELEILVNMDKDFYIAFANARMHTILSNIDDNEIVDIRNIQELQTAFNIKKYLIDQRNYLFSSRFIADFDIKTRAVKDNSKTVVSDKVMISKNTMTKTELLITKINGTYYMIRFTNNGNIETAVYICHMWAKYRKLCSFWETESMIGTKRIFVVENVSQNEDDRLFRQNRIVESVNNNHADIIQSGQDFHILQYKRDTAIVFAAMLPLSKVQ